jgi:uncharacterized protein (TIGR02646 family)
VIYVDRSLEPVPSTLDGPLSVGAREAAKNTELAKLGKHGDMSFTAYSEPPVKAALGRLFNRKCGYCESLLLGNQPGDVEHYRPKKKVKHEPVSGKTEEVPGYFWLAADWHNLLSSCADCNRPRKQEMNGAGTETKGKANWFPLAKESGRAKDAKGIKKEPRLLLDPCLDDPSQHLQFDEDGSIAAKDGSAMGRATIQVCGLDRLELLKARAMQRESADGLIRHILEELAENKEPDERDIDGLLKLMDPSRPFSAFIQHVVRSKLGALFP